MNNYIRALHLDAVNSQNNYEKNIRDDERRKTIDEFAQKVYDLFNKNNGKISLIDFYNLYRQMKGETDA